MCKFSLFTNHVYKKKAQIPKVILSAEADTRILLCGIYLEYCMKNKMHTKQKPEEEKNTDEHGHKLYFFRMGEGVRCRPEPAISYPQQIRNSGTVLVPVCLIGFL